MQQLFILSSFIRPFKKIFVYYLSKPLNLSFHIPSQFFYWLMGDIQVKKQTKQYDAVIVGSGAGGGMAAYVLANAGLKVCLIEAGPMFDPKTDSNQLKNPWESPRRGASTKFRPFGDFDGCYWGWDIDGEPYTHVGDTKWEWWRARMLGGRTNHWGRISLRFGPKDFKRKSIDGLGDDWPRTAAARADGLNVNVLFVDVLKLKAVLGFGTRRHGLEIVAGGREHLRRPFLSGADRHHRHRDQAGGQQVA